MKPLGRRFSSAYVCAISAILLFPTVQVKAQAPEQQGPAGAAVSAPTSPYQMLHAEAGTKAVKRDGRMYFQDPRSVFRLGDDHQIMVEFQWEGPVGAHKFVGMWKDPSGQVVVVSNFQFAPVTSPYSGYFTLLLGDTAPTGIWTIDATVDGQTAGSYSFEIVGNSAALPTNHPERVPLDTKDIYSQMQAASVFIDKLDSAGAPINRGSGFFIAPSQILTAFENIDEASTLRIVFPNGQTATSREVLAWNRWQDWAVLKIDSQGPPPLKLARANSWNIGDHCYALGAAGGGRTILTGGIVGKSNQPRFGERMTISIVGGKDDIGTPVVNQFGEAIGMMGGNVLPGVAFTNSPPNIGTPGLNTATFPAPGLTVPAEAIKVPSANQTAKTLAELLASGVFFPPLTARDRVGFAALALQVERKHGPVWPRDVRAQFSLGEQTMAVFVNWQAKAKYKGIADVHFFDLDGQEIAHTPPLKVNIRPGNIDSAYWTVALKTFSPGIYRVDVDLGGAPAWRQFFRVTL
jgi:S1-C subfamily serine protease